MIKLLHNILSGGGVIMVTGKWKLTINSPIGKQEATLELNEAGGTLTDANGAVEIKDLVIDGENAKFVASVALPFGNMDFNYDLTADGDKIAGQSTMSMGSSPIEGVRI